MRTSPVVCLLLLPSTLCHALTPKPPKSQQQLIQQLKPGITSPTTQRPHEKDINHPTPCLNRRSSLQSILHTLSFAALLPPTPSDAVTDEGISVITDSSLGKSIRKSAIKGAQLIDRLDESWERYSDSRRDQKKCDVNTGRRLYDNGFRRDGTRVGNPVLGALCEPEPLMPLDMIRVDQVLNLALTSALETAQMDGITSSGNESNSERLQRLIRETQSLVRPSFDRSMEKESDVEGRKRIELNFRIYSNLRAIQAFLNNNSKSIQRFQLSWGKAMISSFAPYANRKDYVSPFPEVADPDLEDYDYNKDDLLDALGSLTASLQVLKGSGILGYFEISIPYDDYGSVVTVAIDDYMSIGAEVLLREQKYAIAGPAQALVRTVLDTARLEYSLDAFFIDPTTTKQSEYNPNQLLLSLSNLRKR